MIDQGELFAIDNPCVGVCTSNSKGYCLGCLRSRQERYHWNQLTLFQQQIVINLCQKRKLKIQSDLANGKIRQEDSEILDEQSLQKELF